MVGLTMRAPIRRTKIVVTLGPATDGLEERLVGAGMDVARLNFSHGEPEEHLRRCRAVRQAAAQAGRAVAILQDLPGPKIRTGRLVGGQPVELAAGSELAITPDDVEGTAQRIASTYSELAQDVSAGATLLLDDGRLRLRVTRVRGRDVYARVEVGGLLSEHKGINLPGVALSIPTITDRDRELMRIGLTELQVDYVALSFVRRAGEIREARRLARGWGAAVPIVAKLEKPEAVADLAAIVGAADAVMVARGDLGVELGPEAVPGIQTRAIRAANARGIPVITATQMLESMTHADTPTRAEASDVAHAVWDGSDAVMLSGETAVGDDPLGTVETMDRIVRSAEAAQPAYPAGGQPAQDGAASRAVARAACGLAGDVGAAAIVAVTRTGRTAHLLSAGRPAAPVFAFTPEDRVARRLALWWGIVPVYQPRARTLEDAIESMEGHLLSHGAASAGDRVVVVGSHPFRPGVRTNFAKVQRLGR
jgi:pyruvate kinase